MTSDCFWGVCACDGARELEPESGLSNEVSLPSDRRPTDQPGGGAETLGMSVVSEPPCG